MHERASESERLLEWGFMQFEDVTLFAAGDVIDHAPVWLGQQPSVPLVGGKDLVVTMPRQWQKKAQISVSYESPLRAPVVKGTPVGKLTVGGEGVPSLEAPLLAGADVPRMPLPSRAIAVLSHYVTGS